MASASKCEFYKDKLIPRILLRRKRTPERTDHQRIGPITDGSKHDKADYYTNMYRSIQLLEHWGIIVPRRQSDYHIFRSI